MLSYCRVIGWCKILKGNKIGGNNFKENVKIFMQRGGLTLLIGFLAVGAYVLILDLAGKYFEENVTNSLYIEVTKDGELSINYSKTDEEIYVCWETDGGTVKPAKENEKFKEQYNETNKWYQAYTEVQENVVWDGKDASGDEFSTANVRAIIYEKSQEDGKDQYYLGEYIKEISITVSMKDGEVKKAKDRYFSNPVKKDAEDEQWNEIYIIDESEENKTLRYRTSEDLSKADEDKIYVLCWESEGKIIAETNIVEGSIPHYKVEEDAKYKEQLTTVNTVTVKAKDGETVNVEAFLVDSECYQSYKEKDKEYKAEFQ